MECGPVLLYYLFPFIFTYCTKKTKLFRQNQEVVYHHDIKYISQLGYLLLMAVYGNVVH